MFYLIDENLIILYLFIWIEETKIELTENYFFIFLLSGHFSPIISWDNFQDYGDVLFIQDTKYLYIYYPKKRKKKKEILDACQTSLLMGCLY